MRLLYVACNPPNAKPLMIEDEINELTLRISLTPGDRVRSTFLPNCRLEELPYQIDQHRPDVLHIAAHGTEDGLFLSTAAGDWRPISAAMLKHMLPLDKPPRLVFLNACNSQGIAKELCARVPFVVATTAPITNRAARVSAGLFYSRLAQGSTVQEAFDAAASIGGALQDDVEWTLAAKKGQTPSRTRFCERFEIVARFDDDDAEPKDGLFYFELGVVGCPAQTHQIVLFTDDSTFVLSAKDDNKESEVAFDLAMVGRHTPTHGTVWFREAWPSDGDFRIYGCAVTAAGDMVTTVSMLSDAVERCQRNNALWDDPNDLVISAVTQQLRDYDRSTKLHAASPTRRTLERSGAKRVDTGSTRKERLDRK